MFAITRLIYNELRYLSKKVEVDKRVTHLPFVSSPIPVFTIMGIYVLLTKWGPIRMKDRKPFNVTLFMQAHNIIQVLINGVGLFITFYYSYLQPDYSYTCEKVDYNNSSPAKKNLIFMSYIFLIVKCADLFDTVFFILRKRNSRITFLHVYHHTIMLFFAWFHIAFFCGGHGVTLGIINGLVHTCMYFYYFLATLNSNIDLAPWKKRITQLQICQFFFLACHFAMPLIFNCVSRSETILYAVGVIQNGFFVLLFFDFYNSAYNKKKKI